MKFTGDTDTIYGLALGRDEEGNLINVQLGMPYEVALQHYDNFQAHAILQFDVTVLSSIDGEISATHIRKVDDD